MGRWYIQVGVRFALFLARSLDSPFGFAQGPAEAAVPT